MNRYVIFSACILFAQNTVASSVSQLDTQEEAPEKTSYFSVKTIAKAVATAAAIGLAWAAYIKYAAKNKLEHGFAKFSNPGNACFINATLHGVFASKAHTDYLDQFDRSILPAEASLLHEFFKLYDDYKTFQYWNVTLPFNENYDFAVRVPALFNLNSNDPAYLNTISPNGIHFGQQDAGEFYGKLFDALNNFDPSLNKTMLTTSRTCAHGHERKKVEGDSFIQIAIPNQEEPISISQLLTISQEAEVIDNVECSACGCATCNNTEICRCHVDVGRQEPTYHTSQATRRTTIKPGTHLVLAIKRTLFDPETMENIKARTPLTVEQHLSIGNQNYQLTAVAFHMGRQANGGHWVAIRRVPTFELLRDTMPPSVYTENFLFLNDANKEVYASTLFPELKDNNWAEFTRPATARFAGDIASLLDASLLFYERI